MTYVSVDRHSAKVAGIDSLKSMFADGDTVMLMVEGPTLVPVPEGSGYSMAHIGIVMHTDHGITVKTDTPVIVRGGAYEVPVFDSRYNTVVSHDFRGMSKIEPQVHFTIDSLIDSGELDNLV